ncbi:hypothetical protein BOSP111201_24135 [Bordetella sputigena]|uniref:hypothetical protein n=1 Tax=Bordetella sputigena TaxID=1416810 RepID=UPI0039F0C4E5
MLSQTGYYENVPYGNSAGYYENLYYGNMGTASVPELEARQRIEQDWRDEIRRYVDMGGDKALFVDFISAAKTGFPADRDKDANHTVKAFRDDFVRRAAKEDIERIMALHETIRVKLQRFQDHCFMEGDERTYREFAGRIRRLDCGKRQLQTVLEQKSECLAAA